MAWNPHPKVGALRDYGRKFDADMVMLIAINTEKNQAEITTYGKTMAQCKTAKVLGDVAYDAVLKYVDALPDAPAREAAASCPPSEPEGE